MTIDPALATILEDDFGTQFNNGSVQLRKTDETVLATISLGAGDFVGETWTTNRTFTITAASGNPATAKMRFIRSTGEWVDVTVGTAGQEVNGDSMDWLVNDTVEITSFAFDQPTS